MKKGRIFADLAHPLRKAKERDYPAQEQYVFRDKSIFGREY
jgi:hypothetical protein